MDVTRCPTCNRRLMAITDRHGRTELRCLNCDQVDPMKTDAAKWADSPLAPPTKAPARLRETRPVMPKIPHAPGTDPDGVAKTELDHFGNSPRC